ncbi:hypothetical protein BaRGS_00013052 [Batillaria attramentaria]|uniref:Uncharacterized protein n=1 Tax=Batillaria attramentaria TaxID=370345 RepID=A0ABD0L8D1_9CAEN
MSISSEHNQRTGFSAWLVRPGAERQGSQVSTFVDVNGIFLHIRLSRQPGWGNRGPSPSADHRAERDECHYGHYAWPLITGGVRVKRALFTGYGWK